MRFLYVYFAKTKTKNEFLEAYHKIEGAQNLNVTLSFCRPEIDKLHLYFFISSEQFKKLSEYICNFRNMYVMHLLECKLMNTP